MSQKHLKFEIRGGDIVYLKATIPYHFNGQRAEVTETSIRFTVNKPWQYFITVNDVKLPISAIDRHYPLIRDNHRISLWRKKLIIRP